MHSIRLAAILETVFVCGRLVYTFVLHSGSFWALLQTILFDFGPDEWLEYLGKKYGQMRMTCVSAFGHTLTTRVLTHTLKQ